MSLSLTFTPLPQKALFNNSIILSPPKQIFTAAAAAYLPPKFRNPTASVVKSGKDDSWDLDITPDKPRRKNCLSTVTSLYPLYLTLAGAAAGFSWLVTKTDSPAFSNGLPIGFINSKDFPALFIQFQTPLFLWETLKEAITVYTGLSPATFFTVLALGLAVYYVITGMFGSSDAHYQRPRNIEEQMQPLQPPVQLGEVTEDDFKQYDGSDPKKPLLMAIKGQIYDVSQSRMFYGPGGPYALFAGKDASRALAKMSFEDKDLTGDISGLGPSELDTLQDWEYKFMSKYVKVGTIKKAVPVTEGDTSASEPAQDKEADVAKPAEDGSSAGEAVETHSGAEAKE